MKVFHSSLHRPSELKMIRALRKRGHKLNLLYTYWDIYPGKPSKSGLDLFHKVAKEVRR